MAANQTSNDPTKAQITATPEENPAQEKGTPPQHTRATPENDPEDDVFTFAECAAALCFIDKSLCPATNLRRSQPSS